MDHFQQTIDTYNRIAGIYQEKFMDLHLYDDSYDLFCKLIGNPDAKILEIGCGPGNITRYLLSKNPLYKILAIDAAPNMVALAKINNPAAQFLVMDCRRLDELNETYDGAICGFCMPYLTKEECFKLISDCSRMMNSGGVIYFSTIEGDYKNSGFETSSQGTDSVFVYQHQEDYLVEALRSNRFEQHKIIRKRYPGKAGKDSVHIIFLAIKA